MSVNFTFDPRLSPDGGWIIHSLLFNKILFMIGAILAEEIRVAMGIQPDRRLTGHENDHHESGVLEILSYCKMEE